MKQAPQADVLLVCLHEWGVLNSTPKLKGGYFMGPPLQLVFTPLTETTQWTRTCLRCGAKDVQ